MSSVGIEELALKSVSMLVSPQPSTGVFNIQFSEELTETVNVEVYGITGSKIELSGKINTTTAGAVIDLTGNPNGIYIAKIVAGSVVKTIKLSLFN